MSTNKTETQAYKVIKVEDTYEIRYYPATLMAKINSHSKSYRDLGNSGFGTLAKFIFGGNSEKKQISMTAPVHMEIGDSVSTMAFVMPSTYTMSNLPSPNNAAVQIQTSAAEYVAVIQFGGFATSKSIQKHTAILQEALNAKGIMYHGNFRLLGYNPPYQIFGRRNEIIVAVNESDFIQ
ncbi:MAG: heme-binding protein [Bacteroidota bacterium]